MTDEVVAGLPRALFEEAAKKSSLLWVRLPHAGGDGTAPPSRPVWHVWHDGGALLVGGGPGEQPLHGLDGAGDGGGTALATVRSKDKGGRLLTLPVRVLRLRPDGSGWSEAVEQLRGKRLNAPDHAELPRRWAAQCAVLRLEAADGAEPLPEDGGSGAARPMPTPATTRGPAPLLLHRRRRRRR